MTAEPDPPDSGSGAWCSPGMQPSRPRDAVPLREATRTWFAISLQTFGGPAGQIAVMQHTLVDQRRWIGQRRFLHALNFCMLLPGPEAQQLAIYTGWLLNGIRGGLIAGTLFVLPGAVALLALSLAYAAFGDTAVVGALFAGLAPAVIAIVLQAVVRVARRALDRPSLIVLAVTAFAAVAVFAVPFPAVVMGAGVLGWWLGRRLRHSGPGPPTRSAADPEPLIADSALHDSPVSAGRAVRIVGIGVVLWGVPMLTAALLLGSSPVLFDLGLFFSGTALVTFGGAYAVLAYVAQQAVGVYGWLAPGEMVRGLALAETTPGPLIMVVQFVAFLGAFRHPGALDPWLAGILGSLLVVWVTFVPCFVLVFVGAPYVERLRDNRHLAAALSGITAAVVGVIASLALYFALHTLFVGTRRVDAGPLALDLPVLASASPTALGLTAVALTLVFWRRWGPLPTLAVCAGLGLLIGLLRLVG